MLQEQFKMIEKAELLEKCSFLTYAHYNACRFLYLKDFLDFGRFVIRQIDLVLEENLGNDQWIRFVQLWLAACMAMRSSIECLGRDEFFDSWKNSGPISICYNKWIKANNNIVILSGWSAEQFAKSCPFEKLEEIFKSIDNKIGPMKRTIEVASEKIKGAEELRNFTLMYYEEYVYNIFPCRLQEVLEKSSCEEIKRMKITFGTPTKLHVERKYSQVYETVEINDKPIDLPVLIKEIEPDLNFFHNRKNIDGVFFTAIFDSILRKADLELFSKQLSNIPPKSEDMLTEKKDYSCYEDFPIMRFEPDEEKYLSGGTTKQLGTRKTEFKYNPTRVSYQPTKVKSSTADNTKKILLEEDDEFDYQTTAIVSKQKEEKHSVVLISDDDEQDESDCDEFDEYALITGNPLQSTLKTHLKESKSLSLAKERKYVPNNDNADSLKLYYEETTCRVFKLYGRGGGDINLPWVGATAYELKVINRFVLFIYCFLIL